MGTSEVIQPTQLVQYCPSNPYSRVRLKGYTARVLILDGRIEQPDDAGAEQRVAVHRGRDAVPNVSHHTANHRRVALDQIGPLHG